jgi:hypothetical protein
MGGICCSLASIIVDVVAVITPVANLVHVAAVLLLLL